MNFEDWTLLGVAMGGAKGQGGAKMNFSILTFTRVWGIKCWVINSVDSESERILSIGPSWGQLGEEQRGGVGQK